MGQKRHDQGGIEVLEAKGGRPEVELLARKRQQELEGVGITLAGMDAGAPLEGQPFP